MRQPQSTCLIREGENVNTAADTRGSAGYLYDNWDGSIRSVCQGLDSPECNKADYWEEGAHCLIVGDRRVNTVATQETANDIICLEVWNKRESQIRESNPKHMASVHGARGRSWAP